MIINSKRKAHLNCSRFELLEQMDDVDVLEGAAVERRLTDPVEVKDLSVMPDCGACPGDGGSCTMACRLAEESSPVLFKVEVNDE